MSIWEEVGKIWGEVVGRGEGGWLRNSTKQCTEKAWGIFLILYTFCCFSDLTLTHRSLR